jgi:hypothetical protein
MDREFAAAQKFLSHCKDNIALAQLAIREEEDVPRWGHISKPTTKHSRISGSRGKK